MTTEAPSAPDPITVTVKGAAQMLGLSNWSVYKLLDAGDIESRYKGTRRLVVIESLREYVASLPTEKPKADGAA